jgi:hypothetical protein
VLKRAFEQLSRRQMLKDSTCGFGSLALAGLASTVAARETHPRNNPLAERSPHFAPRAKRVIFMFMQGGPSQYETLEHLPELVRSDGKETGKGKAKVLGPRFGFQPCGESGLMLSELFPHLGKQADELCLLNGMHTDSPAHPQASVMLHTGSINFVRPSLGAWVVYGLGTENENLPGFITINPTGRVGGAQNYGSAFLPASYQGTRLGSGNKSMENIAMATSSVEKQRRQLDLIQMMNQDFLDRTPENREIEGVIQSYELAFRMQTAVPEVLDITTESLATRQRYGIDQSDTGNFGKQCLMARRLAEAGVRFIEINHGGWDQHNNLTQRIAANCRAVDQPIAALLKDLKERGMLSETLIVWGGEFGRTPEGQNKDGRRHNSRGYSMMLAGGGVKGGMRFGATDPIDGAAIENRIHTHDLHATILHLLGIDHERLTYRYAGRDFRLTDVYGNVIGEILA